MATDNPTFRQVVHDAVGEVAYQDTGSDWLELSSRELDHFARVLAAKLKAAGYSIHRAGECVHPRGPRPKEIGRPMTPDDIVLIGLAAVGEHLDL